MLDFGWKKYFTFHVLCLTFCLVLNVYHHPLHYIDAILYKCNKCYFQMFQSLKQATLWDLSPVRTGTSFLHLSFLVLHLG